MLERLLPQLQPEARQSLMAAQSQLQSREFRPKVRPFPAVRDLFERLQSLDVQVGIATTSSFESTVDRRPQDSSRMLWP